MEQASSRTQSTDSTASTAAHSQWPWTAEGSDRPSLLRFLLRHCSQHWQHTSQERQLSHHPTDKRSHSQTKDALTSLPALRLLLVPLQIVYINQALFFVRSQCAAPTVKDREKACLMSIHTQLELPSPRRVTSVLGSRCMETPSVPLCNSRHLQY